MADIYLIRHAKHDKDSKDGSLTKKGIDQAKNLKKYLAKKEFDHIFISTKTRTKQTAEESLPKKIQEKTVYDDRIREIHGDVISTTKNNDRTKNDKKRLNEFYNQISKLKGNTLVICHGNVQRYILSKILGVKSNSFYKFAFRNTGVTRIRIKNEETVILYVNKPI